MPIPLCDPEHRQPGTNHLKTCKKPGKVPMMPNWNEVKLTEKELQAYWRKIPKANVGVVTGEPSSLVGIDIDHGGVEMWQAWGGGPFIDGSKGTVQFSTPHGQRLLYTLPSGVSVPSRQFTNGTGGVPISILSTGKQTVMPPSKLVEKKGKEARELSYAWMSGFGPANREPELMPEWLLEVITSRDDQLAPLAGTTRGEGPSPATNWDALTRAREYLATMGECHPEPDHPQDASTHLLKAADALVVGFNLSDADALPLLREWAGTHYPDKELQRKTSEARRVSKRKPGELLDAPRRVEQASSCENAKQVEAVTFTANDLLNEKLPPLRWVVPGLFPEGGLLIAGRPKGGKSWLALQAALAITEGIPVLGKIACPQAEALYLALEDGKRRLQSRLQILCGEQLKPKGLHLGILWPSLKNGCVDHLELWLDRHPAVKLVIIDTLTKIRDRDAGPRRGNNYELDYDAVSPFSLLGQRRSICCGIIHHTRKPKEGEDDDPFDTISGTLGLAGATDTMAVLKRPIHSAEGQLFLRGRDIEDQSIKLLWESDNYLWKMHTEAGLTPEYRRVVECLDRFGRPVPVQSVAAALGKTYEAAKKLLQRMKQDGVIRYGTKGYQTWDNVPDVPLDASPEAA